MKSKRRRYHPKFFADLKTALDYYDEISTELGNRFRAEIKSRTKLIASTSEGFAKIHNDVRALRLHRFPYVILYRSYSDHVQFVGLIEGSAERKNWFDNIE